MIMMIMIVLLSADLPNYMSPSVITWDDLRPDFHLQSVDNILYVLELTVGFEMKIRSNASHKKSMYYNTSWGLCKIVTKT